MEQSNTNKISFKIADVDPSAICETESIICEICSEHKCNASIDSRNRSLFVTIEGEHSDVVECENDIKKFHYRTLRMFAAMQPPLGCLMAPVALMKMMF